jgi:hypothetical protein
MKLGIVHSMLSMTVIDETGYYIQHAVYQTDETGYYRKHNVYESKWWNWVL